MTKHSDCFVTVSIHTSERAARRCDDTSWQATKELLCTEPLLFWGSSATQESPSNPEMLSSTHFYVTFSKFHDWRCKKKTHFARFCEITRVAKWNRGWTFLDVVCITADSYVCVSVSLYWFNSTKAQNVSREEYAPAHRMFNGCTATRIVNHSESTSRILNKSWVETLKAIVDMSGHPLG